MKQKLSVVVSAYNEGKKLARCLESVSWAWEIIVVDNESHDNTREIAAKYTKKVFSRPNDLMLNKNKNFGFLKASGSWILNLDADEVVTPELRDEIQTTIQAGDAQANGYWMSRKNIIFGKWITHGYWWPDRQLRLFRKGTGKFSCRYIHEYIKVEGTSYELKEPCLHYNYETISQYVAKLERCTSSEAAEYTADGYEFSWRDAIRFPLSDFVKIYFAQEGYKDGLHGLILALLQSFYSFIVFAKLWEQKGFTRHSISFGETQQELQRAKKEIGFWLLTARIKDSGNFIEKIFLRLQKRITS